MKELFKIQQNIKISKERTDDKGHYRYWTIEDIMQSVLGILADEHCTITMTDELVDVCGRAHVKATVTLRNVDTGESESTTAFAEVGVSKLMSPAQCTGSASTYARKYALNGLFAINDTRDADEDNRQTMQVPAGTPRRTRTPKAVPAMPAAPVAPMMMPGAGYGYPGDLAPNPYFDAVPVVPAMPTQPVQPAVMPAAPMPAAPVKPAPAADLPTMPNGKGVLTEEEYTALVETAAVGQLLQNGENPRDWYARRGAGPKQLEFFDNAVNDRRAAMMAQMPTGREFDAAMYNEQINNQQ